MASALTIYKLIILYMLRNSETELTNSQISEFILEREYTNYFHLQQSVAELVEAGLIQQQTVANTSYYRLTEEGGNTFSYFEKDLSPEIKAEAAEYLNEEGCKAKDRILTPADYYETDQGGYAVRCRIIEKDTSVLDLSLSAPSLEAAKSICRNWPGRWQNIYDKIMEELL